MLNRNRKIACHITSLGCVIFFSMLLVACGGGGGGGGGKSDDTPSSTVNTIERESIVNALYYTLSNNKAGGGTNTVRINVASNDSDTLKVGFFETVPSGLGAQWSASGWMAVTMIPLILGQDPTNFEISFTTTGIIDGPSAGGLMSVGLLAAILGHSVDPQVAMTGTINPDGSIGPVGGIVHKIKGAADNGITKVLVPEGQRSDRDLVTGEMKDLADLGNSLGVQIHFVPNIYEAYKLITGSDLPRAAAVSSTPRLPSTAQNRMNAVAKEWISEFKSQLTTFNQNDATTRAEYIDIVNELIETINKAENDLIQGAVEVAYSRAVGSAIDMVYINLLISINKSLNDNGFEATVNNFIGGVATTAVSDLDSAITQLRNRASSTVTDDIALIDAYRYIAMANGLIVLADNKIAEYQSNNQLISNLDTALLYYTLSRQIVKLSKDALDLYTGFGVSQPASESKLTRYATVLSNATKANLVYFESLVVDEFAKKSNIRKEEMEARFLSVDQRYLMAKATTIGLSQLSKKMGADASKGIYQLGNALAGFSNSALTSTTWYSLGGSLDQNSNIVIRNEVAMDNIMSFSEQRAKEMIAATGDDTVVPAITYFNIARRNRQSNSVEEKIEAISRFWDATLISNITIFLTSPASN